MSEYIELRAASAFSFLYGASLPEDLIVRAAELGMKALALADRDGLYGAPRFHQEGKRQGVRAMVGADVTLPGGRAMLLVKDRNGYKNLCKLITEAKAGREKGDTLVTLDMLEMYSSGLLAVVKNEYELDRLRAIFPELYLEIGRHYDRAEERNTQRIAALARAQKLPLVATNDVRYSHAARADLCDVLTCIREGTTLDSAGTLLQRNAERHLKSAVEMRRLFRDLPDACDNTVKIAEKCAFTLEDLGYRFPDYPVPEGETLFSYLKLLVDEGARRRYRPITPKVAAQIAREMDLIAKLNLAGYFLIVWDIVEFCRHQGILVQGRGSAANSAVCYSLGITAVDPVGMELLFERFLSEERGEWPDIDLDLPSGDQRERVIQHVYQKYGARGCAMTANVITYRPRSAVREVGKALGLGPNEIDRIAKRIGHWEFRADEPVMTEHARETGLAIEDVRTKQLIRIVGEMQGLPRHLGQHSGGMIVCHGRLDEVVPLEPASMPGRVVVQWDKEDCADLGIIKVDLLGLGMMAVLEEAVPLVKTHDGVDIDLAHLPPDDKKTYAMIQRADTVGVFQIESRAQMATLPRMKPEKFYDLVVEVAIIRPGPIVGQMVHPYLKRRAGREKPTYPHPSLEPILKRTLGVPLFQEQLMRIAMVAAGFTGGEAEELRRAMGSKRSMERMEILEKKLRAGMTAREITGEAQNQIVQGIRSFALYGFPESHSASFALIVYASCYLKAHHPAAFFTALLNNWPMGFYHPATLLHDARRHQVRSRPIDVQKSAWKCTIENNEIRIGLKYVAGLKQQIGERIVAARPFSTIEEVWRKSGASQAEMATLASIGALNSVEDLHRRAALWRTSALGRSGGDLFASISPSEAEEAPSPLAAMELIERLAADFAGTGLTTGRHPMAQERERLRRRHILSAAELASVPDGARVQTAGGVIVRQRPGTAKGFFFITLEDETGFSNAIITPQIFAQHRTILTTAPALIIGGKLQNQDGVVSLKADQFAPLREVRGAASRDFH
jgi:error-prone DNA polymerase